MWYHSFVYDSPSLGAMPGRSKAYHNEVIMNSLHVIIKKVYIISDKILIFSLVKKKSFLARYTFQIPRSTREYSSHLTNTQVYELKAAECGV